METSLPVTLIVKAPNQQVADQTITCEPSWTIGKLKGHLSQVYPSQPKLEEQKLIYSGRLLSDTAVLKDVLRKFEGQDTHTVHLVCTSPHAKYGNYSPPKKTPPPNVETQNATAESSRSNVNSGESARSDGPGRRAPAQDDNREETNPREAADPFRYNAYMQEQMAAWASQFNQWSGGAVAGPPVLPEGFMPGINVSAPRNMDPMMFAAQMAWMQHMRMQQYYNMAGFSNSQPHHMNLQANNSNQNENVPENREALPVRREEPENANEGADAENRDWLDWFYHMGRWVAMFSIVYFYSNPIRFLTVFILGTFIYLFQARVNNEAAQNEQRRGIADNINNNYQPQINNNEPVPNDGNAENSENVENDENNQQTVNNAENANEESLLSITWSAFTSFFTSLIPEVPNGRN